MLKSSKFALLILDIQEFYQPWITGVFSVIRSIRKLAALVSFLSLFITGLAFAATHEPLKMDEGFKFSTKVKDSQTVVAEWQMAKGYYLYRDHLKISASSPDTELGQPIYPPGVSKTEPEIGTFEVYKDKVSIAIPVVKNKDNKVQLTVKYQGCSEEGFCYPSTEKTATVDLTKVDTNLADISEPVAKQLDNASAPQAEMKEAAAPVSEQDQVQTLLSSGHFISIVLSFLGFGVLLAFTPCVLPMIPILSGIIVGQNREKLTTSKAFSLSLIYVLSMSFTYAIAGVLIGYVGGSIQAAFQKPWLLITFSFFFVVLAMSFFGFYELKLPQGLHNSLSKFSGKQRSGSYLGVAVMGCIATLIVSPCVTPALVGALGYIGKSGNAVLGGSALFALGFGMGLPLLLIGTAGAKLLPKAGMWMDRVKTVFGMILLGMAIWILDRILPGQVTLLLWSCLLIFCASFLGLFSPQNASKFNQGLGAVCLVYGVCLLIGSTMGHTNPLQPLYTVAQSNVTEARELAAFKQVADLKELDNAIISAKAQNKIVMLDFTANWCTSCKLMEHRTFSHPEVAKALSNFVTLRADVTDNDTVAKNLEKQYQVVAPPTLLFFDSTGKELAKFRVVGEMGPKEFLEHLQTVMKANQ